MCASVCMSECYWKWELFQLPRIVAATFRNSEEYARATAAAEVAGGVEEKSTNIWNECVENMFSNNLLWCIWMHNHEILWLKMYGKHFWITTSHSLPSHIVVFFPFPLSVALLSACLCLIDDGKRQDRDGDRALAGWITTTEKKEKNYAASEKSYSFCMQRSLLSDAIRE